MSRARGWMLVVGLAAAGSANASAGQAKAAPVYPKCAAGYTLKLNQVGIEDRCVKSYNAYCINWPLRRDAAGQADRCVGSNGALWPALCSVASEPPPGLELKVQAGADQCQVTQVPTCQDARTRTPRVDADVCE